MRSLRRLAAVGAVFAAAGFATGLAAGALAAGGEVPDPGAEGLTAGERYEALVARSSYERSRLRTLEASFIQRQESPLLLEPEESSGTFSYRAPDRMRWEFTSPTAITIVVRDQEMVTWYRDLGRVERLAMSRQADHVLRLLGPGSSLEDLLRYFTLNVTFPAVAGEPYRLQLKPRSSRIARRIRSMTLRLDPQLFLPSYVRYEQPGSGSTELEFEDLRVNGELPSDRFELRLPEGVEERSVE